MQKEKFTMRVGCYLALMHDEKVLLLRRQNTTHYDNGYALPAGHVDGNETIAAAMVREAREEVDLTISESDLEVVHAIHYRGPGPEYIYFFFNAKKWTGEPKNMEPEKCDDVQWFPINSLPPNTVPYVRQAIENIRAGITFSEYEESGEHY